VAGTALLPWEEWLARLLHPVIVAIRRWSYERRHRRDLGTPDIVESAPVRAYRVADENTWRNHE